MSVEVSAGVVVVLGCAWVGVPRQDLRVAERDAGVEGVGDGGVTQRVWADVSRDARDLGDPHNHQVDVSAVDGIPRAGSQDERPLGSLSSAGLEDTKYGDRGWHGGGLVAFPDQAKDSVTAQGVGVVLDAYCGCFGGAQGVDAEKKRERPVMNREGLGDLEETDELDPVKSLGTGLVVLDLRKACVDGRVGCDQAVDVCEPEEAADAVHHRDNRGVHQAGFAELVDVQLDVGTLDPEEWIQSVVLAPVEPAPELVGVKLVRAP